VATYRLEAKVIGRSQGRNATASAAYRAAERIEDERTGAVFDYTRKRGVVHAEILAPAGTPDWMQDRAQLWNVVERVEKRPDSQLARDVLLSLPHELTHAQRVALVREFVAAEFVSQGMIADIAIHAPDRRGDQRNHHAHVMLTMRHLSGDGFGKKNRDWNKDEQLNQWRADWSQAVNRDLERHGHEARVTHRSLKDQGVDREPEPKQGPIATEMERAGRPSHAGDDRRAAQARNEECAALAAELGAVTAQIIDLDQERARRAAELQKPTPEPSPALLRPDAAEPGIPTIQAPENDAPAAIVARPNLAPEPESASNPENAAPAPSAEISAGAQAGSARQPEAMPAPTGHDRAPELPEIAAPAARVTNAAGKAIGKLFDFFAGLFESAVTPPSPAEQRQAAREEAAADRAAEESRHAVEEQAKTEFVLDDQRERRQRLEEQLRLDLERDRQRERDDDRGRSRER
jgi:MobA/MobL family